MARVLKTTAATLGRNEGRSAWARVTVPGSSTWTLGTSYQAQPHARLQTQALPEKNKTRGFIEYERRTDGYRDAATRVNDWGEINIPPSQRAPEDRVEQAARCMDCGTPYCFTYTGCPINNPIPMFNELVFQGRWKEAWERLSETNNFPEFTGRVCPAPCEGACISGLVEDPVTIKDIEYSIVDRAWEEGWIQPRVPAYRTGLRVAVVGSGPAGLAAADMLNQSGHEVVVYERAEKPGGLLMYGIPNMKLDKNTLSRRIDLLEKEGVSFVTGFEIGVDSTASELVENFDATVLAIGATQPRDLSAPGREKLKGVYFAMDLLTASQKSLDYGTCPPSMPDPRPPALDPMCARGKRVVVVGGGDTGTDCIATVLRLGAESVVNLEILQRPPDVRAADNPWPEWPRVFSVDYGHAEVSASHGSDPRVFGHITKEIIGDSNGNVSGLQIAEVDSKMQEIEGSAQVIPADMVILAMGFTSPEQDIVEQLKLAVDDRSNILADADEFAVLSSANGTALPGVFAAGDCRRGQSLVVWAINEGRSVAEVADRYLLDILAGNHKTAAQRAI